VLKISYKILTVVVFMLFAMMSRAENSFLVDSVSCSGTSTQSFLDVLSFNCAGDLSLDGGSISANTSILLSATGTLGLNNLILSSQDIFLNGGSLVSVGSDVYINASKNISISSIPDIADGTSGGGVGIVMNGSLIAHGGNVLLNAGGDTVLISKDAGTLSTNTDNQVFPGGNISLVSSVPEPSSYALLLLGLSFVILALRAKAASPQRMIF
jgi:hypothetical protein